MTLTSMKVLTVTGPDSFWLGPSPDQQRFVVRSGGVAADSARGDGTPADTAIGSATGPAVRAGQTVAVSGVIKQLPSDLGPERSAWSLSTANEATLTRERIDLDADRVDVTNP